MNTYEQKQEARRNRLRARAAARTSDASAAIGTATRIASHIPPGQPILVGHHSERRHRRDLEKIDRAMRRSIEAQRAAEEASRRADAVGTAGISSDDPDALAKLRARLEERISQQDTWRTMNRLIRRGDVAGIANMGYSAEAAASIVKDGPQPRYRLANNSHEIRRLRDRIANLERAAARATKETDHPSGVRIVENVEANRVQLFFPGKPDDETRRILKGYAFKWAPSVGAWQRYLSDAATRAAHYVLNTLPVKDPTP